MKALLGVWQGMGQAIYPTIETTRYREQLTFRDHPGAPRIQYEQMTWRIHDDNSETLLHWELGFIRQTDIGEFQWTNAQNNGRVEVMKGTVTTSAGGLILDFQSIAFANDPRMVQSARQVTVDGNILRYRMQMETQSNPTFELHLEAELTRA